MTTEVDDERYENMDWRQTVDNATDYAHRVQVDTERRYARCRAVGGDLARAVYDALLRHEDDELRREYLNYMSAEADNFSEPFPTGAPNF